MRIVVMAVAVAAEAGAGPGRCEPPELPQGRLLGEWVAPEPKDGDYTRLRVSRDGADWAVEVWRRYTRGLQRSAAAGRFRLHLLGDGVKDTALPYAWIYLTLRVVKDQLLVERYLVFTDDSGRSNYRTTHTFKKK